MKIDKPGIYQMTSEEYHADPCPQPSLSSSQIVNMLARSPLHVWSDNSRMNPNYESEMEEDGDDSEPKFDIGKAAHRLILEGVDDIRVIDVIELRKQTDGGKVPKVPYKQNWATNVAKDARAMAREEGYTPLLPAQAKGVRQMVSIAHKAIAECPELLGVTIDDFNPEMTLIWQEDGIWCRARPDLLHKENLLMVDLKSTQSSAAPAEATRRVLDNMSAYVQAAWYRRGLMALTGIDAPFIFLNQESRRPYACSFVRATTGYLAIGESKISVALPMWRECLRSGVWPGYSLSIYQPEVKPWVERDWINRLNESMDDDKTDQEAS